MHSRAAISRAALCPMRTIDRALEAVAEARDEDVTRLLAALAASRAREDAGEGAATHPCWHAGLPSSDAARGPWRTYSENASRVDTTC